MCPWILYAKVCFDLSRRENSSWINTDANSPPDMWRTRSPWPVRLVGPTCGRSYQIYRFGRIFAEFSTVDTNWPEANGINQWLYNFLHSNQAISSERERLILKSKIRPNIILTHWCDYPNCLSIICVHRYYLVSMERQMEERNDSNDCRNSRTTHDQFHAFPLTSSILLVEVIIFFKNSLLNTSPFFFVFV